MADNEEGTKSEIAEKMDAAAVLAKAELAAEASLDPKAAATWVAKWYEEAGHKRLSRALIAYAKVHSTEEAPKSKKAK